MAQKTDAQLKTDNNVIRNETVKKANTKTRVADTLDHYADSKVNRATIATTGTVVQFDVERTYGAVSPETGNITVDTDGACLGMVQLMRHNHPSAEPTFSSPFKRVSGEYVPGVLNYIYMEYISTAEILVSIMQQQ